MAARRNPCAGAVGSCSTALLWSRARTDDRGPAPAVRDALPFVGRAIEETFRTDLLVTVHALVIQRTGYLRPRRDASDAAAGRIRVYLPLRTDECSVLSDDDAVYHLIAGDVWSIDPTSAHSIGNVAESTSVQLVLDFAAVPGTDQVVRDEAALAPGAARRPIVRPPLTPTQQSAIEALSTFATEINLPLILDFLGAVHFERDVPCAAAYDWLVEIAHDTGSTTIVDAAMQLRTTALAPMRSVRRG